jgi:hypothetical protein
MAYKHYYGDLITRCARLYFRHPDTFESKDVTYKHGLDELIITSIKKVIKHYDPEKLYWLDLVYKMELDQEQTSITGVVREIIHLYHIRSVWNIVYEFERKVAEIAGII